MVQLAELLTQLRAELIAAMSTGEGSALRFELGPVELELTMAVGQEDGVSGKVKFWVLELGGDQKMNSASTQTIRLTLNPRSAREPDKAPLVSGQELPGER